MSSVNPFPYYLRWTENITCNATCNATCDVALTSVLGSVLYNWLIVLQMHSSTFEWLSLNLMLKTRSICSASWEKHYWELNCGNTSAVEGRSVQDHTGQSWPWGSQHVLCECHLRVCPHECNVTSVFWNIVVHANLKHADATERANRANASIRHRLPEIRKTWHYWELNCGNTSAVEGRSVQDHTGQSWPWGSQHVLCECHLRVCPHECNVTSVFWSIVVHANLKHADATERANRANASRRHRLPEIRKTWHYWELNCGNTSAVEGRSVQDHTGQSRPWGSQHVLCECHLRVCPHECNVTSVFWSIVVHANLKHADATERANRGQMLQ